MERVENLIRYDTTRIFILWVAENLIRYGAMYGVGEFHFMSCLKGCDSTPEDQGTKQAFATRAHNPPDKTHNIQHKNKKTYF